MLDLLDVQHAVTALLNLAVALLTGAAITQVGLARDASRWAAARRPAVERAAFAGILAALSADIAWLWLESAIAAEVPVSEGARAAWSMLTSTHLGLAWCIGMAGLAVAAGATWARRGQGLSTALVVLAALGVFWYARGMVSHAASDGDFSVRLLADWMHLALTSLWVGEVLLAGGVMLRPDRAMGPDDRRARAAYVAALSGTATFALAGILVTGLYAAWRNLDGAGDLVSTPYGKTLLAKLLLVGVAASLGGFNRFFVMRPWRTHESADESAGRPAARALAERFRRILWAEALVLLAVLVVAAWLAATSPN